ncbi:uncharacterized protein LOC110177047 [Drosophila serrata]|uniref:uncharacterized protein LOC110177047 n=1 Tax=Drosophila serrata TaxID=7274 RepID=UPI000A1D14D5|nr:uncharacterized protein LOC110177047 [Drosophila serrata]
MVDSPKTSQHLQQLLLLTGFLSSIWLGGVVAKDAASDADTRWMAPLKQYGYTAKHLKNKVEHGEFTTFELGTPNYKILNPEDEPEYITADQPHYQEMLRRLTSGQSGTETIDVDMAVRQRLNQKQEKPQQVPLRIPPRTKEAVNHRTPQLRPSRWDKLNKKRSSLDTRQKRKDTRKSHVPDELSLLPNFEVYSGARPFQNRVANLN